MLKILTKLILNVVIWLSLVSVLQAQNQDHKKSIKEIHQVLEVLFDGMREGDSAKVASVFDANAQMYSSYADKDGYPVIKKGGLQSFLMAIGTPHKAIWDERLANTQINIDGGIAQVWTDYSFYLGNEFSHCGVDAFQLIYKPSVGWRIIHLMDTRRSSRKESPD